MRLKLLVLLMLLLGFGITKSETKKVEETQILSNELKGFEADYLTKAEFRKQAKENKKIFGWLIDLVVNWVMSLFSDSWGEYNEDTGNTEGPYFLFSRDPNGKTPAEQLAELRTKIINKQDSFHKIYADIIVNAKLSIGDCSSNLKVCPNASIAKSAAFVYVVGIKKDASTGEFEQMPFNDRYSTC